MFTLETATLEAQEMGGGLSATFPFSSATGTADTASVYLVLEPGGVLIAWKRGDLGAELTAARRAVDALGGGALDVHDVAVVGLAGHRLVTISRTGQVPDAYPRDPATRRRRPW